MNASAILPELISTSAATKGYLVIIMTQTILLALVVISIFSWYSCCVVDEFLEVVWFSQEFNEFGILILAFADCVFFRQKFLYSSFLSIIFLKELVDLLLTQTEGAQEISDRNECERFTLQR